MSAKTNRKSEIEDGLRKYAKDLDFLKVKESELKNSIGNLAKEYKDICDHGEYEDTISAMGFQMRSILRWRSSSKPTKP